MPEDALNPYAPPVAAEPLAPVETARLWMVQGEHLLVRDGARLPPVPLLEEEDGGGLTTSHQVFAAASGKSVLASLIPFVIALLVVLFFALVSDRMAVLEGMVALFVSSRLLRRFVKTGQPVANIQCYLALTGLRARARRDRWRARMLVLALAGFLLFVAGARIAKTTIIGRHHEDDLWMQFMVPVLLLTWVCFFGSLIWQALERSLKCVRHTDGWFYLTGVPATSLMKLAAMSPEPPPARPRKLYTLYQYRLPLGILLGPRRNPLLLLVIAIMKATRSPALLRRCFHWSEAHRGVAPDEALADHLAKLQSLPEFAGWQYLGCNRLDSPLGELRVLTARLAAPDRRHFCQVTIARISKARAFVEVTQTDFRTWTADGRCLITSSQPPFPQLPADVDFQHVRGNPARAWSRHRARCERATTIAVESDDELKRLLEKESEDHSALLQAAGIRGPIEEVEMPGDWDEPAKAP